MTKTHYCIDCMNFKMRVVYSNRLPKEFNTQKVRRALRRNGRVVIFICRITGAFYVNNMWVFRMQKKCPYFNDPSEIPSIKITISNNQKQ